MRKISEKHNLLYRNLFQPIQQNSYLHQLFYKELNIRIMHHPKLEFKIVSLTRSFIDKQFFVKF